VRCLGVTGTRIRLKEGVEIGGWGGASKGKHIFVEDDVTIDDDAMECELKTVAEPAKLLGPHAPVLVSKTSDGYACAPNNLTRSVRVSQGPQINDL
jgi:hypothetical protein